MFFNPAKTCEKTSVSDLAPGAGPGGVPGNPPVPCANRRARKGGLAIAEHSWRHSATGKTNSLPSTAPQKAGTTWLTAKQASRATERHSDKETKTTVYIYIYICCFISSSRRCLVVFWPYLAPGPLPDASGSTDRAERIENQRRRPIIMPARGLFLCSNTKTRI